MTKKRNIVLLVVVTAASAFAAAQSTPSVSIGLSVISLGEPASDAITSLSRDYNPTVVDGKAKTQQWLILNKEDRADIVGELDARGGKVVGLDIKTEIFDHASADNAFTFLFSLVNKLKKESRNRCVLTSGTDYVNGWLPLNKTVVDFSCGPYDFYILKDEYHDKESGQSVDEYVIREQIGEIT